MLGYSCANCKWEIAVRYDCEGVPRCSDCGSEILGCEEEDEAMANTCIECKSKVVAHAGTQFCKECVAEFYNESSIEVKEAITNE